MRFTVNLAAALAVACALSCAPAWANSANLEFAGTVNRTCTINIGAAGVLDINSTGTVLSSKNGIGTAATASIVSTGADFRIDVTNPSSFLVSPAGGSTGVAFDTRYKLVGDTTTLFVAAGNRTLLNIGTTVLSVDLTATRSSLFPAGAYAAQTTVTCE